MKVHSISQIIAVPLVILLGYYLYIMFYDNADTFMVIVPTVLLAVLYVSAGQIDYWWMKKNVPAMDDKMKQWFEANSPYYNSLATEDMTKFENRLVLYVNAREFKSVGSTELREVPFDIKNIIASQGVRLGLGLEDFLIKDLDRIYMYKHPFPTPKKQYLHTVESDIEDGMLIVALDYALPGIINPYQHYNIVLHGYAEAFVAYHPEIDWPDVNHYGWTRLELINGIFSGRIEKTIGENTSQFLPIHIVAFFEFSDQYDKMFTTEYKQFAKIFNQDPAKVLN
jgi:Mlc titration factor MtfA (ptsG expression regulator)